MSADESRVGRENFEKIDGNYISRIRRHYVSLLAQYGGGFRSVDWGSKDGQNKRFEVLLGAVDFRHAIILDVGCGVGDLVNYLKENKFEGKYLGVDIVPEMIEKACSLYSGWDFRLVDSFSDLGDYTPDLVVASGLFTFSDPDQFKKTINQLFQITNFALAFNSLSSWGNAKNENEYNADPVMALDYCRRLSTRAVLRHDYLPHDFTVYLFKK